MTARKNTPHRRPVLNDGRSRPEPELDQTPVSKAPTTTLDFGENLADPVANVVDPPEPDPAPTARQLSLAEQVVEFMPRSGTLAPHSSETTAADRSS